MAAFQLEGHYIDVDGGYYVLDVVKDGGDNRVIVDYERTEGDGDFVPIGRQCVFNEAYANLASSGTTAKKPPVLR